jgi:MFS family permease
LLLGGKLGDLFGHKRTLIAGLVGFSVASAIGGLAPSFGVRVVAGALQGAFGALLAPSAFGVADGDLRGVA